MQIKIRNTGNTKVDTQTHQISTEFSGIVLGGIQRVPGGYQAFDKHAGEIGGVTTCIDARIAAKRHYEYRDYCENGCGELIFKARYCLACRHEMTRGLGQ